jgi:hypothetical protein
VSPGAVNYLFAVLGVSSRLSLAPHSAPCWAASQSSPPPSHLIHLGLMQNPQDPAKSSLSSGDSEMHQENTMQEDSDSWPEDNCEPECGGCNNLREQLEVLSANRAFEMETLSQHRFLISKL